jgi:hypothetical protein
MIIKFTIKVRQTNSVTRVRTFGLSPIPHSICCNAEKDREYLREYSKGHWLFGGLRQGHHGVRF